MHCVMRSQTAAQTDATLASRALHAEALTTALTQSDAADRYAAVCDGAVKYLPDLRAFAKSLAGNLHQADDLVQGAILRALDASHHFQPGTNFKAWSFTILRNIFYNQWRSPASRHVALDDCTSYMPMTEPSQDKTLEFCDLRRAFAQLGPDQRKALMLVGVSGLDYAAAAKICGVAPGTMKSRVSRARATLRELMDGGPLELLRSDFVPLPALDLISALRN
jgi:RNA polymerase sigma-70 factor, ECF subfamily